MAAKDLTVDGRSCSKCENYSHGVKRCKLGRVLPINIKRAVEITKFDGPSYLCPYLSAETLDKILDGLKKQKQHQDAINLATAA